MCMNEPVPDDADVTEIPVKQENSFGIGERPDLEPMERLNLPNNITSYVTQIRNQPFDITRKYMLNEVDIVPTPPSKVAPSMLTTCPAVAVIVNALAPALEIVFPFIVMSSITAEVNPVAAPPVIVAVPSDNEFATKAPVIVMSALAVVPFKKSLIRSNILSNGAASISSPAFIAVKVSPIFAIVIRICSY